MAKKVIKMTLSEKSIQQAIKEVEQYKKDLNRKCQLLVSQLVKQGVKVAKMQVQGLGAYYTGQLEGSINGYFSPSLGVGFVRAESWYAMYVEFGTGIEGKNSPHPKPANWTYDVNGHGEDGWYYFNDRDQRWHWTTGMPARPFMYNTAKELEAMCGKIAKEVFRK